MTFFSRSQQNLLQYAPCTELQRPTNAHCSSNDVEFRLCDLCCNSEFSWRFLKTYCSFFRAIRTDRVVQASTEFIHRVLGRKFLRDEPPDLGSAMKQSSCTTPIVLFFTNGKLLVNDCVARQFFLYDKNETNHSRSTTFAQALVCCSAATINLSILNITLLS